MKHATPHLQLRACANLHARQIEVLSGLKAINFNNELARNFIRKRHFTDVSCEAAEQVNSHTRKLPWILLYSKAYLMLLSPATPTVQNAQQVYRQDSSAAY